MPESAQHPCELCTMCAVYPLVRLATFEPSFALEPELLRVFFGGGKHQTRGPAVYGAGVAFLLLWVVIALGVSLELIDLWRLPSRHTILPLAVGRLGLRCGRRPDLR